MDREQERRPYNPYTLAGGRAAPSLPDRVTVAVFARLCAHANWCGDTTVSVATVMDETRYCRAWVNVALATLKALGRITKHQRGIGGHKGGRQTAITTVHCTEEELKAAGASEENYFGKGGNHGLVAPQVAGQNRGASRVAARKASQQRLPDVVENAPDTSVASHVSAPMASPGRLPDAPMASRRRLPDVVENETTSSLREAFLRRVSVASASHEAALPDSKSTSGGFKVQSSLIQSLLSPDSKSTQTRLEPLGSEPFLPEPRKAEPCQVFKTNQDKTEEFPLHEKGKKEKQPQHQEEGAEEMGGSTLPRNGTQTGSAAAPRAARAVTPVPCPLKKEVKDTLKLYGCPDSVFDALAGYTQIVAILNGETAGGCTNPVAAYNTFASKPANKKFADLWVPTLKPNAAGETDDDFEDPPWSHEERAQWIEDIKKENAAREEYLLAKEKRNAEYMARPENIWWYKTLTLPERQAFMDSGLYRKANEFFSVEDAYQAEGIGGEPLPEEDMRERGKLMRKKIKDRRAEIHN